MLTCFPFFSLVDMITAWWTLSTSKQPVVAFDPAFYWTNDGFQVEFRIERYPTFILWNLHPQKLVAFYPRGTRWLHPMTSPINSAWLSMAQHGVCGGFALTISLRITVESTGPVFFPEELFFSEIPVASSNFSNSNVFNCNIGQIYLTVILYINWHKTQIFRAFNPSGVDSVPRSRNCFCFSRSLSMA